MTDKIKLPEEPQPEYVELKVITRHGWEALPPKKPGLPLTHPVPNMVMAYNTHVKACFNEDECKERMREIQKLHFDQGLDDIHYNFAIGSDGNVYEGRGWDIQPADFSKNPDLEEKSVCIGVIGDGNEPEINRPLELITAIYFMNSSIEKGYVEENYNVLEDAQKFD